MSSRQYEEYLENEHLRKISEHLGISVDEYLSLDPSEIQDNANDDGFVSSQWIEFKAKIPRDLANKISGLYENKVEFPPGFFESDDEGLERDE